MCEVVAAPKREILSTNGKIVVYSSLVGDGPVRYVVAPCEAPHSHYYPGKPEFSSPDSHIVARYLELRFQSGLKITDAVTALKHEGFATTWPCSWTSC